MATGAPRAALIISTYNWPEALGRVLESALRQTEKSLEIVVADDGSRVETAAVVERVLRPSAIRWCHVWQEDRGFRLSRVRNLGVRHSQASQLIFVDHDVLLHPEFVADHLRVAGPGTVVLGKRCFLSPSDTGRLLDRGLEGAWWPRPWQGGLGNRKNAVRWPLLGWFSSGPRPFRGAIPTSLRGSNLAVDRQDFLRVDGFDETYDGSWGREDSDFCCRLFHCGVMARHLSFLGLQAHLHHPEQKRQGLNRNDDELARVLAERRTTARRGYSRLAEDGVVAAASGEWG